MTNDKKRALDTIDVDMTAAPSGGGEAEMMQNIGKILAEIQSINKQVSVLPQLTLKVDHTANRVELLEARMNALENPTSSASDSPSVSRQFHSTQVAEESVWLSGGWTDRPQAESFRNQLMQECTYVLDTWIIDRNAKVMLFAKLHSPSDRMRLHQYAASHLSFLRESHPHVWLKLGRSKADEAEVAMGRYLFNAIKVELKKTKDAAQVDEQLMFRTRDISISFEGIKLVRLEGNKKRYDVAELEKHGLDENFIKQKIAHYDDKP
eukprot:465115-Amphidinium_carterae.1